MNIFVHKHWNISEHQHISYKLYVQWPLNKNGQSLVCVHQPWVKGNISFPTTAGPQNTLQLAHRSSLTWSSMFSQCLLVIMSQSSCPLVLTMSSCYPVLPMSPCPSVPEVQSSVCQDGGRPQHEQQPVLPLREDRGRGQPLPLPPHRAGQASPRRVLHSQVI